MALKMEHKCTRCGRATSVEVQNVAEATKSEELDQQRADTLKDIQKFLGGIAPELLPDLYIIRRGEVDLVQTYLCADEDAKRSCLDRVSFIVNECNTLQPRKPKTKKAKPDTASAGAVASDKTDKKQNNASAKQ